MLHGAPRSGSTGGIAASEVGVGRQVWAVRDAYTSHRSQFIRPRKPPSCFLLTGLPLLTHTLIIEEERPEETPRGRFAFSVPNNSDQTQPRR